MNKAEFKITSDGILVPIKIIPKASSDKIVGWEENALKIRITAIPEKGEANQSVIKILSKTLKIAKSNIVIVKGETSRNKIILFRGETLDSFKKKIQDR